jgi:hypothetical protein
MNEPSGYQYVWLAWSSAFLLPWVALYWAFPTHRRAMRWASVLMAPFGLTEPLFVPEYWNPPSLFDLAWRTGFDIESIVFSFAIGGIGAALYNVITRRKLVPVSAHEKHDERHRFHYIALALPFVAFPILYFLPWNPIYAGIAAMIAGAAANVLCRPDLKRNTLIGGLLFLGIYTVFLTGRVDGARLHRTGLEPEGALGRGRCRFAPRGTAVRVLLRALLDCCLRAFQLDEVSNSMGTGLVPRPLTGPRTQPTQRTDS